MAFETTLQDIYLAGNKMNSNKSQGFDGISADILHYGCDEILNS